MKDKRFKIKRPETIAGIPVEGAMERYLAKLEKEEREGRQESRQVASSDLDREGFIYVPSVNLHFSKERSHKGLNWYDCHKQLHEEGMLMPTIPQFLAFLNYLRTDYQSINKQEADKVLDDILTVRDPWRGEWLDADFKFKDDRLYIHYNHRTVKDDLVAGKKEVLRDYLTNDKRIDLEDWLNRPNKHGLPFPNVKSGDFYYWQPLRDNNSVAGFYADSDWAVLGCYWYPSYSYEYLGVFACAEGAQ